MAPPPSADLPLTQRVMKLAQTLQCTCSHRKPRSPRPNDETQLLTLPSAQSRGSPGTLPLHRYHRRPSLLLPGSRRAQRCSETIAGGASSGGGRASRTAVTNVALSTQARDSHIVHHSIWFLMDDHELLQPHGSVLLSPRFSVGGWDVRDCSLQDMARPPKDGCKAAQPHRVPRRREHPISQYVFPLPRSLSAGRNSLADLLQ
jgi:hypothetical protein